MDLSTLELELQNSLKAALKTLVKGTKQNLDNYVIAITKDFTLAMQLPTVKRQKAAYDALMSQLRGVAELQRIQLVNISWAAFNRVVDAVLSAAAAGLRAAL